MPEFMLFTCTVYSSKPNQHLQIKENKIKKNKRFIT